MPKKISQALFTILCALFTFVSASAQGQSAGETVSTATKLVISKVKLGTGETYEVRGKATFTLTAANTDGSFAGNLTYTVPDDARAKIAEVTGKPITQIPVRVIHKDVVATFQKATACPVLHFEFSPLDINVAGASVHFNRFVLDINDEGQKLHRLLCVVAKQINAGRAFRGVVQQINATITGVDPNAQTAGQE
jgi:hypothetical protein